MVRQEAPEALTEQDCVEISRRAERRINRAQEDQQEVHWKGSACVGREHFGRSQQKVAKLQLLASPCLSVRLPAYNNSRIAEFIFMKSDSAGLN
jgi:hypothetical protein